MINALERNDFPEDPRQMVWHFEEFVSILMLIRVQLQVLASWGEWWPADTYDSTFDEKLQDLFSPSKEQIEEEERVR